jgi:saccharopine dehydrogenase-like NADP-dependent oxidoreductase
MAYNILIAGAGQLGSRCLQGLSKFIDLFDIYVFDISDDSKNIA